MRLGGPLFQPFDSPEAWLAALGAKGYTAAFCPVQPEADDATVAAYEAAARDAGIVIAEVGTWSNPLSRDQAERTAALDKCINGLALADRIGARCCVNIAGSRGTKWDGPCPEDLTDATFDRIVESVRTILDAVQPTRTFYCLETMPWMYPDSPDSYLQLLAAIDRPAFGVHFDPVNLVNCPSRCFHNGDLIREFVRKLGPRIRSCHAKDIRLETNLTVHLNECRPGLGTLDYATFFREVSRLDPDTPILCEHLPNAEEYDAAVVHLRQVASEVGVAWR